MFSDGLLFYESSFLSVFDLLFNYSVKMFDAPVLEEKIDRQLALRYADLLSKSIHPEKADQHKIWGQEIAILLKILYPNDPMVKYYLGSVLSSAGNYRGLQSKIMEDFEIVDVMDGLYYCYDKLKIPTIHNPARFCQFFQHL